MQILVVNPNSTQAFTQAIAQALEPLQQVFKADIVCETLSEAPPAINTQHDIDTVVAPLCRQIEQRRENLSAVVVACFADPGVVAARELFNIPIIGCCEAGISMALNLGERFGIISTLPEARNAELRQIRALGLENRMAGMEPIAISTEDIPTHPESLERLKACGDLLKAQGAESIVLGCAGMVRYKQALQDYLQLPVVDPVIAAVGVAVTAVINSQMSFRRQI